MKKLLPIFLIVTITLGYFYLTLPVLSYGFSGITFLLIIIATILFFSFSSFKISSDGKSYKAVSVFWKMPVILLVTAIFYALVLPFFTSHPIFRNQDYRNLIGKVANGDKLTNHIER